MLSTPQRPSTRTSSPSAPSKVNEPMCGPWSCMALLNGNARQVNASTLRALQTLLPGRVVLTTSREDARDRLSSALDEGIDVIFAGGGDGTVVQTIQTLVELATERNLDNDALPMVSILPLGTGNALAAHFGLRKAADELALMTNGAPMRSSPLRFIHTCDGITPNVGFGVDCDLTGDYITLKKKTPVSFLEPLTRGLPGYVMACLGRTIPRLLNPFNRRPVATFINSSQHDALRISHTGEVTHRIRPGEVIFQGPVTLATASTISCYGFGMKFFPWAEHRADRFHLRIYDGDVITPALRVRELFQGSWRSKHLHDVLVDSVNVELDRPIAVQSAGDLQDLRTSMEWSLSPREVSILRSDRPSFN